MRKIRRSAAHHRRLILRDWEPSRPVFTVSKSAAETTLQISPSWRWLHTRLAGTGRGGLHNGRMAEGCNCVQRDRRSALSHQTCPTPAPTLTELSRQPHVPTAAHRSSHTPGERRGTGHRLCHTVPTGDCTEPPLPLLESAQVPPSLPSAGEWVPALIVSRACQCASYSPTPAHTRPCGT